MKTHTSVTTTSMGAKADDSKLKFEKIPSDSSSYSSIRPSPRDPSKSFSLKHSNTNMSSYMMEMPVKKTNATLAEEQLATMARVINELKKTIDEKDVQIASLMNKLES